ncbi:MAG: hypothetical protein LBN07_00330 [Christensenellaceae bacterium]|jgi:membrane protein implicated in regulation of membrane protease activity|nr:hypothetical protein [Christensenellaceae bacterium]
MNYNLIAGAYELGYLMGRWLGIATIIALVVLSIFLVKKWAKKKQNNNMSENNNEREDDKTNDK